MIFVQKKMYDFVGTKNIFNPRTYTILFFLYVKYIYRLMSLILNIVINFFNKQENISLGFLIYLLYLNNYSFLTKKEKKQLFF